MVDCRWTDLLLLLIILFLCFPRLFEIKHNTIDTIAKAGRRWSIVEYMSKMRFTASAHYFSSVHTISVIRSINDAAFADWLVETWPPATAFKFGIANKKGISTYRAIIGTCILAVYKRTAPWAFGALLPGNLVNF